MKPGCKGLIEFGRFAARNWKLRGERKPETFNMSHEWTILWRVFSGRLIDLHSRVHRGAYRAKPSRRVFIPKADERQHPLGVAALEDKIVQQTVVTILNQIYEVDSSACGRRLHRPSPLSDGSGRRQIWVRRREPPLRLRSMG
jgi:hypothetical protein